MRWVVTALDLSLCVRLCDGGELKRLNTDRQRHREIKARGNGRKPILIARIIIRIEITELRSIRRPPDMPKVHMEDSAGVRVVLFMLVIVHKRRTQKRERQDHACQD